MTWSLARRAAFAVLLFLLTSCSSVGTQATPSVHMVTYQVGGSARGADITYTSPSGDIAQQSGVDVPLHAGSRSGLSYRMPAGAFVQISAQNTGDFGTITCAIDVDGVQVTSNFSSGGFTIASCSATIP